METHSVWSIANNQENADGLMWDSSNSSALALLANVKQYR